MQVNVVNPKCVSDSTLQELSEILDTRNGAEKSKKHEQGTTEEEDKERSGAESEEVKEGSGAEGEDDKKECRAESEDDKEEGTQRPEKIGCQT